MLTAIERRADIASAQKKLKAHLEKSLGIRHGNYTVGYQGGKIAVGALRANDRIWYATKMDRKSAVPRFWNAFGISSRLALSRSNVIAVEVNVALEASGRQVAGLFAKDNATGHAVLLHSGKIGGGKGGVGKQSFLKWYGQAPETVAFGAGTAYTAQYLRVADLAAADITIDIARFVEAVSCFKAVIDEEQIRAMSDAELQRRLATLTAKPKKVVIETTAYTRSALVVEFAKRRANGICTLCREPAPFADTRGAPFLECHHIEWLRNGGSDSAENAVALCPNCHRRMHVVKDAMDVATLCAATR